MAPPEPPAAACLRAAELHATNRTYRQIAEVLRGEGYQCGSQQTAWNWAQRGRQMGAYTGQLDRDDARLRLAEAIDEDIQRTRRRLDDGLEEFDVVMRHLRWLYREYARLMGTDAAVLSSVTVTDLRREDPAPDPGVRRDAEAALAQTEREQQAIRRARLEERQRQEEGA